MKMASASLRLRIEMDGRVPVETAHHEISNELYTTLAQRVANALGTRPERVTVHLGDTALPSASLSGSSSTTVSLAGALRQAACGLKQVLVDRSARTGDATDLDSERDRLRDLAPRLHPRRTTLRCDEPASTPPYRRRW